MRRERSHPTPQDNDQEQALVERASSDPDAFGALYRAHVDAIYRFVFRRSRSREVTEDVTSATFEKALRGIDRFTWQPSGFRPWLYRIAANELSEHYRSENRDTTPRAQVALGRYATDRDATLDPVELTEEIDVAHTERGQLADALNALDPSHQEVISLRYLVGLSVAEAADALGCSRGALAVRTHRAIAALRKQLRPEANQHRRNRRVATEPEDVE